MKQPKIIIGVVALIGLLVLIVTVRKMSPGAAHSGKNGKSDSGGWLSWSDSDTPGGSATSLSAMSDSERRQREIELAEAVRLKRNFQGAAGGPATLPRYPSDPGGIGRAIIGVKPALRECYESFGRRNQKPLQDVHVHVTVGPDPNDPSSGIVTKAETTESSFQYPAVENCLKSAVSDLRFERPSEPVDANLPLVFAQRH